MNETTEIAVPKMPRILVVDDSEVIQFALRRWLDGIGECVAVGSGAQARDCLATEHFDLVLLDYLLGGRTGLDITAEFRRKWSSQELPIVIFSAAMDPDLEWQALRAGANDCLAKPLQRKAVMEMVTTLLRDPYVKPPSPARHSYHQLTWSQGGHWRAYCPEVDARVEAESRDEAISRLAETVRERWSHGTWPDLVTELETSAARLFDPEGEKPAR